MSAAIWGVMEKIHTILPHCPDMPEFDFTVDNEIWESWFLPCWRGNRRLCARGRLCTTGRGPWRGAPPRRKRGCRGRRRKGKYMGFNRRRLEQECQTSGTQLPPLAPGIDGALLLWALAGNESSFGTDCTLAMNLRSMLARGTVTAQ
jgi:hypothetical protein